MPAEPSPAARRTRLFLALFLGAAGFGVMGWASVVLLNMLDGFATEPWGALLPRLALSLAMFCAGFWLFTRGLAAVLRPASPEA